MAWSSQQRQLAARAWKETRQDDALRKVLLRQFPRAMFDAQGVPSTEPSSKSPRLTQTDYEMYMAHVETMAGGQLKGHARGKWNEALAKEGGRLAWKIQDTWGRLAGAGAVTLTGLPAWIERMYPGEGNTPLQQLDAQQLVAIYEGLKAFARRRGVRLNDR